MSAAAEQPLRRNRDFNLLWGGQVLSFLGSEVAWIAFPLLVLATTGSPARAGIVGFAEALPRGLLMLPAGALVDRWDRKRTMILVDAVRGMAFVSVVAALAVDALSFGHIVAVVAVDGAGSAFFMVAERSALPHVVADHQLEAAMVRNQAREFGALLAGQPLGGVLFSLGRSVPFVFDAVSYLVSVVSLSFVRARFQVERAVTADRLRAQIAAGLRWFWRHPFVRTTSLLSMGNDLVLNSLYLVVIVLARERGASAALIGAMLGVFGAAGIVGSFIVKPVVRALSVRGIVVASQWLVVALVPLLFVPGRITPGIVFGAMFLLHPAWSATVSTYRLRVSPDELRARVAGITGTLSLVTRSVGVLVSGALLEAAGSTPTVWCALGAGLVVALAATTSPAVRSGPVHVRD